jgi:hypothetical protein
MVIDVSMYREKVTVTENCVKKPLPKGLPTTSSDGSVAGVVRL